MFWFHFVFLFKIPLPVVLQCHLSSSNNPQFHDDIIPEGAMTPQADLQSLTDISMLKNVNVDFNFRIRPSSCHGSFSVLLRYLTVFCLHSNTGDVGMHYFFILRKFFKPFSKQNHLCLRESRNNLNEVKT